MICTLIIAISSVAAQELPPVDQESTLTPPQDALMNQGMPVALPEVTLACLPFILPENQSSAEEAIENSRTKWFELARAAKIKKFGVLFVDTKLSQETKGTGDIQARICSIVVTDNNTATDMDMMIMPRRHGMAGFCLGITSISACLNQTAFQLDSANRNLPIYARWSKDEAVPTSADAIMRYLLATNFEFNEAPKGEGKVHTIRTGLQPISEEENNFPDEEISSFKQFDKREITSPGIGWIIPLSSINPPSEKNAEENSKKP